MRRILLSIVLLAGLSGVAFGQTAPASEIAPSGKLRVGMISITVLGGVAEPVARFIGQSMSAPMESGSLWLQWKRAFGVGRARLGSFG